MINGIINVYKETGYTSHDVVARLRGIFKQKKIGHTGTLDPDAEGVLPVCLGKATKLCDLLTDTNKKYLTVMKLGYKTDTQDMTGKILNMIPENEIRDNINIETIEKAIYSFVGEYNQIPPMYSALKVNGKKLYELARQGKEVERSSRPVNIFGIDIIEIDMEQATAKFEVECSKGTYIRTLCNDIGEKLGCGASMLSLIRTKAAGFVIENSIKIDEIESLIKNENICREIITPIDKFFENYKKLTASENCTKLLYNGNSLPVNMIIEDYEPEDNERVRIYDTKGRFTGVYIFNKNEEIFDIEKMFFDGTD